MPLIDLVLKAYIDTCLIADAAAHEGDKINSRDQVRRHLKPLTRAVGRACTGRHILRSPSNVHYIKTRSQFTFMTLFFNVCCCTMLVRNAMCRKIKLFHDSLNMDWLLKHF